MLKSRKLFFGWLLTSVFVFISANMCVFLDADIYLNRLFCSIVFMFWLWISGYTYYKFMMAKIKEKATADNND